MPTARAVRIDDDRHGCVVVTFPDPEERR